LEVLLLLLLFFLLFFFDELDCAVAIGSPHAAANAAAITLDVVAGVSASVWESSSGAGAATIGGAVPVLLSADAPGGGASMSNSNASSSYSSFVSSWFD